MKVDKRKVSHWLYLVAFGANALVAILLRPFWPRPPAPRVVLYGHKLSGNLAAIYEWLRKHRESGIDATFLTMDPAYHRRLREHGESACLAVSPGCIPLLASASALISDHGLHVLSTMLGRTSIKFFDVWHGIPFKGFDAQDFRIQHRYDEIWVASPLLRDLYVERFGFGPACVQVTGYARTDRLVNASSDAGDFRQKLGLTRFSTKRFVLFAPTWKQDSLERSLFPWGLGEDEFLEALAAVCRRHDAVLLVRKHLNSGLSGSALCDVVYVPYAEFPDTEAILLISDVLICDWSSIAFDYLLLDRPTLFLDVEPPFQKGFSLGPEYRFGRIVSDMPVLLSELDKSLRAPEAYMAEFGSRHQSVRQRVYGEFADGKSAQRCVQRLAANRATTESFR